MFTKYLLGCTNHLSGRSYYVLKKNKNVKSKLAIKKIVYLSIIEWTFDEVPNFHRKSL